MQRPAFDTISPLGKAGIHTELIFCMLGGRSISNALSSFGIADTSKALIVAIFDAAPDAMAQVVNHIKGTPVAMSSLGPSPAPACKPLLR